MADVAVVTGASRGAGKGIALALAETGAVVYVTGRTVTDGDSDLPGSLTTTARQVTERGGIGIAVPCDHADDVQVEALFARVAAEHGRLDILVNNAFAIPDGITSRRPFWQKGLHQQGVLDVGLRSTYVASFYAAPLLVQGGRLLVNTSSFGGTCYMHGPAYGAVKAGVDKMAHDMAEDLRRFDVAAVSLWMGFLRTERTEPLFEAVAADPDHVYRGLTDHAETAEFPGRVIAALAASPERMNYSGRVLVAAEVAAELGVTDVAGNRPPSQRALLGSPPQYSDVVIH
ncbi:SDR family NAD(P)-dependent oxidoreductase [Jatrophihabitans sp.]|uniref:SDR family NAD(P)-dependent oxidoreductase n=1 Tax=Jatrophihabitans sp. TaxID=1932789 RepID=UPI0030C7775B|nr:short chain dehydrogenase [Jatrophihabitans sp.]